ncbi:MAG: 4Fe-4S dicluster domain-containing protein [Elusimicrobia bacterium]|nr:4Fe-4S dicluster domain-containing protein [Elusimicrobiota bacterium]
MLKTFADLENFSKKLVDQRKAGHGRCISICSGTGCHASGSEDLAGAFEKELKRAGLQDQVTIRRTGCHGFCERGPILVIEPEGIFYQQTTPDDVPVIVEETIKNKKIVDRLLYAMPSTGEKIVYEKDVPFYKKQTRFILAANSLIDPKNIDDYISMGGYTALAKALKDMKPETIVEEVKQSGLRGRGGAGFATGIKWELCRKSQGIPLRRASGTELQSETAAVPKYIIANGDEGDPGAYMDRSVMEGNPHSVIEGMIIGAYAIGAEYGFIYVRAEYPLAVENLELAIEKCREYGFLGKNILGSGFDFDIEINTGAGAFVCGEETALIASLEGRREETALIASLEGRRGMPRTRPPYPAVSGFSGRPTDINNVETWANVPLIIVKGAKWFSSIGTEKSKGTKIFSLVGKVNNTGLVEVPMGIKLSEIIYGIGGGIPKGREFKAVQTGGPSGGCLPKEHLDLPIDYESLAEAGSIMGSGGMIVMDEDNCMVDVARYFLDFTQCESCGKCVPCRVGTRKMHEILGRITEGKGRPVDIAKLEELAQTVKDTSLCGLGQTAPKKCVGCSLCEKNCPAKAISGEPKKPYRIDVEKCTKCGTCLEVCPAKVGAVKKESPAMGAGMGSGLHLSFVGRN